MNNMFSPKLLGARNIFFLTVFFVFLFLGGKTLAAECVTSDLGVVNVRDCTVSIVYQDPGGSGLAFCGYRLSTDINWTSVGACSGNSASFTIFPFLTVPSAGDYGIFWKAQDSAGNEDTGAFKPGKTFSIGFPPSSPGNLQSVTSCGGSNNPDISLTWTDNSNDEDGFRVYRSTVSAFIPSAANLIASRPANSTSYTDIDPALLPGATYYYKVAAYNAFGESGYASSAGGIIAPTCAPTFVLLPPSASILGNGTQQFDGEYDSDGPGGAAAPTIVSRASITWSSNNSSIVSINASGLATGQGNGSSAVRGLYAGIEATALVTVVIPPPSAPSGLSGVSVCAGSNNPDIVLTWTDNANNEDGFKIYRGTTADFAPTDPAYATLPSNASSYVNTMASAGVTYYYKIKAYNAGGDSAYDSSQAIVAGTCAPTFSVTPSSVSIPEGGIQQFGGQYDPDGPDGSAVTQGINGSLVENWTSSNIAIADINSLGWATGNTGGTVTIQGTYLGITASASLRVATLSVSLSAAPELGPAPLSVSLTATVSGTAQGTINYKFDCTSDGIWDVTFNNISDNPKTAVDACNYGSNGTYYATVEVERDTAYPASEVLMVSVGDPPDTIIDSGPANPTNQTSATFVLHGTNPPIAWYSCKLDSGGWSFLCASTKTYPSVAQGSHVFQVRAANSFGLDMTPAVWNWLVDATLPVVTQFSASRTLLNISNPTVTFSWQGSDAGGANLKQIELWRRPQGGAWTSLKTVALSGSTGSGNIDDTPLSDGVYEYGLHLLDNAGNIGYEPSMITITVDKTAPPKPTCLPAGGTFMDLSSVTCSDAEAGTIIRYTTNSTPPDALSGQYSGALAITSSQTLTVAGWDGAGNRSALPDNSYSFIITTNQAPSVSAASASPNLAKANTSINFSVDWSDPDVGDQAKIHVCKTNSLSSQACSGLSWCDTSAWSSVSPTVCNYTAQAGDAGVRNYYAFACDDNNACSSSQSGTFLVDASKPQITGFSVSPVSLNIANPVAAISWTVTDAGGSHLSLVSGWKAVYDSLNCSDANKAGCAWSPIFSQNAPVGSDGPWSSSGTDSPSNGVYWYGLHAQDVAGNEAAESDWGFGVIKVTVDKTAPESHISSPSPNAFKGSNFSVSVADLDTGGSTIDPNECKYSVRYCADSSCASRLYSVSDQPRTCNASTPNITVGPGGNCPTEGLNTCRIIAKSKDRALNPSSPSSELDGSGWPLGIIDLSVDLTDPVVNTVYCDEDYTVPCASAFQGVPQTYKTLVSDNVQISNCYFYTRPVGGSWTEIQGLSFQDTACPVGLNGKCYTASKDYDFPAGGDYEMRAYCWDGAGHTKYGPTATISVQQNHAPQITAGPSYTTSPCSTPTTQPGCNIKFSVTATDADNDFFGYSWDLTGDGLHDSSLREPTAFYSSPGSRNVTIKIFDGRGGIAQGSIAVPVTAPTLQASLTATPTSGVYPLNGVDFTASVSGTMYGTIDYRFDCGEDATNDWELQVYGSTLNPYSVQNLCDYPSAGTYSPKVSVNRGTGNVEVKTNVNVSANQSPQAVISVDYSQCGVGANSSTAYNKCVFKLVNSSTDPNGASDIKSSIWTIKEKFTLNTKDTSSCLTNPLCSWSLLSTIPAGIYVAELRVEDLSGAQSVATREFTVRQDITADFMCSLDNINWKGCGDPRFKPVKGGRVYFSDNLADSILSDAGLPDRKSVKSEGSLTITQRTWKKDGVVFSPAEVNLSNPSSIIQGTIIELIVEDDVGRSDSQSYDIQTQLPIPEWQEISPF